MTPADLASAWIEVVKWNRSVDVDGLVHYRGITLHIVSPVQRSGVILRFSSETPIGHTICTPLNGQGLEGAYYEASQFNEFGKVEFRQDYYLRRPIAMYHFLVESGVDAVTLSYRFEGESWHQPSHNSTNQDPHLEVE